MSMMRGVLPLAAAVVIAVLSLAAGVFAAAVAWAAVARGISHANDGDDINVVLNMFDARSVFAGLIAGLVVVLVTASLLDWLWRSVARRFAAR